MTDQQGYRRKLVAMDFSAHSEAAFQQAIWLARTHGTRIVLAHTLPDLRQVAAWKQFLVGSTASRLIRKCRASVWSERP